MDADPDAHLDDLAMGSIDHVREVGVDSALESTACEVEVVHGELASCGRLSPLLVLGKRGGDVVSEGRRLEADRRLLFDDLYEALRNQGADQGVVEVVPGTVLVANHPTLNWRIVWKNLGAVERRNVNTVEQEEPAEHVGVADKEVEFGELG